MIDRLSRNSAASPKYLTLIQFGFFESKYRRLMRQMWNMKNCDYLPWRKRVFIGHVENACRSLSGSRHHSPSPEKCTVEARRSSGQARRTGPRVGLVKDVDRWVRPGESVLDQDRRAQFLFALRR